MKKDNRYALITNDVETTSLWHNCLRDETVPYLLKEGMPQLLEIYEKFGVKSTFFFTGYIAEKSPEIVRMILSAGHEVGCHGLTHKPEEAFDVLSFEEQVRHLTAAKKILEDITGSPVISFRAPALRVNEDTPKALLETGFLIDSSIASQRFDFFLSFGGKKKLSWFLAPRIPYRTKEGNLFRKGDSLLSEVPISAMIVPYLGTTLRVIPTATKIVRHLLHFENRINHKPILFVIHPNELIEEFAEKREFQRRAQGVVSYLWSDLLRNRLKLRNLGNRARVLLEREIEFLNRKGYKFVTVKDYCREMGLCHGDTEAQRKKDISEKPKGSIARSEQTGSLFYKKMRLFRHKMRVEV